MLSYLTAPKRSTFFVCIVDFFALKGYNVKWRETVSDKVHKRVILIDKGKFF